MSSILNTKDSLKHWGKIRKWKYIELQRGFNVLPLQSYLTTSLENHKQE